MKRAPQPQVNVGDEIKGMPTAAIGNDGTVTGRVLAKLHTGVNVRARDGTLWFIPTAGIRRVTSLAVRDVTPGQKAKRRNVTSLKGRVPDDTLLEKLPEFLTRRTARPTQEPLRG